MSRVTYKDLGDGLISTELLKKYDVPVPRYTSYPTVPFWSSTPTSQEWLQSLDRAFQNANVSWALYMHIPFCETLCTYCGCNTVIGRSHKIEEPYVRHLHQELELYSNGVSNLRSRPLKQLHLGGGTPTFLSAPNLDKLLDGILKNLKVAANLEASVEVDPRRTNRSQLEVLRHFGFSRVSMGVQDFSPEVQRLVNRIQPKEKTAELTRVARELGYESVNYDLIYGLPSQTPESFLRTVIDTIELRPDRIALYSLAVVPWVKPQQRLFREQELPSGVTKWKLYELASEQFLKHGYVQIGMDHFALPNEALARACDNKTMRRNFMGYTEHKTDVLLGLGVSAISETPDCFHQNEKVLSRYENCVNKGYLPTLRGHKLDDEDRRCREQILQFMTQGRVDFQNDEQKLDVTKFLSSMFVDELVRVDGATLILTEKGRPFLRNACVAFDMRLRRHSPEAQVFSLAL